MIGKKLNSLQAVRVKIKELPQCKEQKEGDEKYERKNVIKYSIFT